MCAGNLLDRQVPSERGQRKMLLPEGERDAGQSKDCS